MKDSLLYSKTTDLNINLSRGKKKKHFFHGNIQDNVWPDLWALQSILIKVNITIILTNSQGFCIA